MKNFFISLFLTLFVLPTISFSQTLLEKPAELALSWHENPHLRCVDGSDPKQESSVCYRGKSAQKIHYKKKHHERAHRGVPQIPLARVKPFLDASQVFDTDELSYAPYVVGYQGEHIAGGRGSFIYVKGLEGDPGQHFTIFRADGIYSNPCKASSPCRNPPNPKEINILGFFAEHIGDAVLVDPGNPATLKVTLALKEIIDGDRLLPSPHQLYPRVFIPHYPSQDIHARIISMPRAMDQVAKDQVVVINKGLVDGLMPGHVLEVYQAGKQVIDPIQRGVVIRLPNEYAGEIMLFRTFSRVSFGLILQSNAPIHIFDLAKNPRYEG
jgi:hypothetical protein